MSKESDTVLPGVTRPKPDLEPESEPKRLKPEPESESGSEYSYDDDSDNEADALYLKTSRNLSPSYDAIPIPLHSRFVGGYPIHPLDITDENRPYLEDLSKSALLFYQNKEGASFEFHDLVKCTYWFDSCTSKYIPGNTYPLNPTKYYITFKAKAKGDPSSNPETFQAKVLVDEVDRDLEEKDKPIFVEECHIKI